MVYSRWLEPVFNKEAMEKIQASLGKGIILDIDTVDTDKVPILDFSHLIRWCLEKATCEIRGIDFDKSWTCTHLAASIGLTSYFKTADENIKRSFAKASVIFIMESLCNIPKMQNLYI